MIRQLLLYLALAGSLWLGYTTWREHQRELGREEIRAQAAREAQTADTKREIITQVVEREVVRRVKDIQVVTETIIKEVPVYVPLDSPPLPGGFRLLHDAAASGEVPNPAALPDAAPATAQDVAATVSANYGTCRLYAARVKGWEEWARQQLQAR